YAALDAVGQATLTTSALAPGVHNITVVYGGDLRFSDSSSAPLPEVIQLATNTDGVSTANSAVFGQPLSFTATLTTTFPGMTPTGHVTFSVDNGPPSAPVILDASGQASFSPASFLSVGNHTVTVAYVPTGIYLPSGTALTGGQTIRQAATSTTVAGESNPSVF